MNKIPCPDQKRLADYCLGNLSVVELELLEKHLDECDSCQETVERLDLHADTFVAELRQPAKPDPHQNEPELNAALKAAAKPPTEKPFDPYQEWFGIPPAEQLPNHYRLLGLTVFEGNPATIENAAERQTAHVRKLNVAPHTAAAEKLLHDINRARTCLLNVEEKKKYDNVLRARLKALPVANVIPVAVTEGRWIEGQVPRTTDDFLRCLEQSGLTAAKGGRKFLESLPPNQRPVDAKICAAVFANAGQLTPYQARAIYQGKPYGLVVADREVLDLLGKGGMGNVFKARNRHLDRIEAIKIITPKKLDSSEAKKRFAQEARAAARLNHPNVVATYDAGEANGVHFLAMEFVDGCDLSKTVKEHGPMPMEHAISCIMQAAAGLQAAHEKGIIHRDIKPHNLFLDRKGGVKILDLGLARLSEIEETLHAREGLTQSGQIMGTIDYMSPEQTLDVRKVSPASDVYSLGCTLHFLLTGKTPFQAETIGAKMMAHHHQAVPSLCTTRADVPPALDAVFQRMMAKNPLERLQTMNDVIAAL